MAARSRRRAQTRPEARASARRRRKVSQEIRIALDAMGGDRAPAIVLQGADLALGRAPGLRFLLFGAERAIHPLLDRLPNLAAVTTVHHTSEIVSAEAKPSLALRTGRRSSMGLAIDAVAEGLSLIHI